MRTKHDKKRAKGGQRDKKARGEKRGKRGQQEDKAKLHTKEGQGQGHSVTGVASDVASFFFPKRQPQQCTTAAAAKGSTPRPSHAIVVKS